MALSSVGNALVQAVARKHREAATIIYERALAERVREVVEEKRRQIGRSIGKPTTLEMPADEDIVPGLHDIQLREAFAAIKNQGEKPDGDEA
jgi:hypothetical protein